MILCDNCKHVIDDVCTDCKIINGERVCVTYLYCKNCHAKFVSYFDDDKTLKLKREIRALSDKIFNPVYSNERARNLQTLETKKAKLQRLTNRAKRKYMKYFE